MNRKLLAGCLALAALVLLGAGPGLAQLSEPGLAQSSDEVNALRAQIETLKAGQAEIQKDLAEIKKLLLERPRQSRSQRQARAFTPLDLAIDGAPFRGQADAPVTLVEFTDYQCPFCRRHFNTVLPQLLTEYVDTGKIKYVVKEFPIRSLHPGAPKASEAALCAGDQNQYWGMHDLIFQNPKKVAAQDLKQRAETLGLDAVAFAECLDGGSYTEKVQASIAEGSKAGVRGTPSFLLGATDPANPGKIKATKFIRGAQGYAAFKKAIDELLKPSS